MTDKKSIYESQEYPLKKIPQWIRLIAELILLNGLVYLLIGTGIMNYRHKINSDFADTSITDITIYLSLSCILIIYNLLVNNKIVEYLVLYKEPSVLEIKYVEFFCLKKTIQIPTNRIVFSLHRKLGFHYYNYVLNIKDNQGHSFKIRTNKYGWNKETIDRFVSELQVEV